VNQPDSSLTPKQKYVAHKMKQASEDLMPNKDDTCEDDVIDQTSQADGDVVQDHWSMTPDLLIRHHNQPRTRLYVPVEKDLPIPLKYIDVMRVTYTNIDDKAEHNISDIWCIAEADVELSLSWIGTIHFSILRPQPPDGYKLVMGRLTRTQTTNRPDNIWPAQRQLMSKKLRETAIKEWEIEKRKREEARAHRGIHFVPSSEVEIFNKITDAKAKYAQPDAPAMPVISVKNVV